MRMILLSILAVVLPPADRHPLPSFQFRDWRVRDAYSIADTRFDKCAATTFGKQCVFSDKKLGGVQTRQVGALFGPAGLFAIEARFATSDASIIEAALRQRYGPPCQQRTEQLTNLLQQRATSDIRVWCFREGQATFRSVYTNPEEGGFIFKTHDAAKQAAVVDF